jgi:hypothetical protein
MSYPPLGFALLRAIELLAEASGAMAALKVVTAVAARYLRHQDQSGSIAVGRCVIRASCAISRLSLGRRRVYA